MTDAAAALMSPERREQYGRDWFHYTMTIPAPPSDSAYRQAGIANFVFAEMWSRPGLDMRARRWITLACVGAADTTVPITAHVYAAMKSGDISYDEMMEFVLHFAVYSGWPKASIMEQVVREQWAKIEAEGGIVAMPLPDRPAA
jgi:4-carboxymuconolactone decarboxylase